MMRPLVLVFILALLAAAVAAQAPDPETARVQVVEKMEHSVAVVRLASAEVIRERSGGVAIMDHVSTTAAPVPARCTEARHE